MIVHPNKSIEQSSWFTADTYPGSYFVDETTEEGKALAEKINANYPNFDFVLAADGQLVDVISTSTQEDILNKIKQNKINELVSARDQQLYAGFASNATGTTLYFGFDSIDQAYLQEKALLMQIDTTVVSIDWKTRDGWITLTRDQFFQVVKDGGAHKEGLVRQLMQLEATVMNCTDEASVNAIVW